jgi:adenosylhomocysteine nucleosidase
VTEKGAGFVIAATGLRTEARIAARSGGVRAVVGGDAAAQRLDRLLRQSIVEGGEALISFGIAAGLAPECSAGACLIGREVVYSGTSYSTDPGWTAGIKERIGGADLVTIAGVDQPLACSSEKRSLYQATGAAAADLESHIVAGVAAELGLPFAVLRVIADPAEREVPLAALAGMRPDGGMEVGAVLVALARSPRQLPALVRLAADAGRALVALHRCSDLLGPRLGFRDLG